jgi:hypothetical protein
MQVIRKDIFSLEDFDAICITTNGFVKRSGAAVMGAGVAKQAKKRWPYIDYQVGENIDLFGNVPFLLTVERDGAIYIRDRTYEVPYHVLTFPVKPSKGVCEPNRDNLVPWARSRYDPGQEVPGWHLKADLKLIEQSADELEQLVDHYGWQKVAVPAPGCGNGGLTWEEVRPVLEKFFDQRFFVTNFETEGF